MKTILNTIADYASERVKNAEARVSFGELKNKALAMPKGNFAFSAALKKSGMSFICEIKKASPSKGVIDPNFDFVKIASDYTEAEADCISCLTEPKWFLGSDEIFETVRKITPVPMLRKDFTISEYQIYEAKCLGADCVLLICSLLGGETLKSYIEICTGLGLDALVETHSEAEIENAVNAGANIIGVNNRNLKNFDVSLDTAMRLRDSVPPDKIFVAESGIKSARDVRSFSKIGADAVLIGETLMRAENKSDVLNAFREAARI